MGSEKRMVLRTAHGLANSVPILQAKENPLRKLPKLKKSQRPSFHAPRIQPKFCVKSRKGQ